MAVVKSPIQLCDAQKIKLVNPETINLYKKYEIDMSIRDLSEGTIKGYKGDIFEWFNYIIKFQDNKTITKINEDDITEFLFYCKNKGNSSRRMKRRTASLSAFYKFLRRKRLIIENPMEFVERSKKDIDVVVQTFLTENQVEIMKTKLKENGDLQLETYALLSLSTMARVNAISNIS
jgi:site-specific recombinase XerD